MSEHVLALMIRRVLNQKHVRYAPFFDGVTQYAKLAQRAIDVDGDIDIEFWTPTTGGVKTIVYQGDGVGGLGDNDIWILRNGSNIEFRCCGTPRSMGALADGEKFRVTLSGATLTLMDASGVVLNAWTFNRGAYRAANPVTLIGVRLSEGFYINFFQGVIPGIRINNLYYAMDQRNNPLQPSFPAGNDMTIVNHTDAMWREVE
ncbi:TPA: hypothetical protein RI791_002065 [Vibrio cholerae]|nr:hypothetical protein [Vibrio cholerae]